MCNLWHNLQLVTGSQYLVKVEREFSKNACNLLIVEHKITDALFCHGRSISSCCVVDQNVVQNLFYWEILNNVHFKLNYMFMWTASKNTFQGRIYHYYIDSFELQDSQKKINRNRLYFNSRYISEHFASVCFTAMSLWPSRTQLWYIITGHMGQINSFYIRFESIFFFIHIRDFINKT